MLRRFRETKHRDIEHRLSGSALKVDHDNLNSPRASCCLVTHFGKAEFRIEGRIGNRKRPLQQSLLFCTPNLANGGGVGDHETRAAKSRWWYVIAVVRNVRVRR